MAMNNRTGSGADKMGRAPQKKPENTWNTIRRLTGYMKKSIPLIIVTFLIIIAGTVMQVLSPKLLGSATTLIFHGITQGTGVDFHALGAILCTVGALYAGVFVTSFLQQYIMTVISQKTTHAMRNELKAKMNRVPVSYFDKHPNGELMSVAVNDVDNIVTNLQQSLVSLLSSAVLVAGVLWMMLSISPFLTLLACITLPGSLLVMKFISPKAKRYSTDYFSSLGRLNSQIEESYQGFSVIKTFNGEDNALDAFDEINRDMYSTGWKARFIGGLSMPGMLLVQNIVYVLIAAAGCFRVVSGAITIGNIQAFLQYSSQFSSPLMQLAQIWTNVISMVASAERVFEMLDAEETVDYKCEFPDHTDDTAKVVFDHVEFGYTAAPLLKDFSMAVDEGQMVAIVGRTGAGKTTLIHLLERFYEIRSGSLRIDGKDIRSETPHELRSRIGMVLQDTWLFSGTIYDNIKYGNESATDEQIFAAARAAYADDFIQKLPDGYQTVLGEDAGNISQGQRQLITIARACVSDPEILILDEATSSVDSRTELTIQKAMKHLLKGRTSFVVAHRLSTIYDADRILVMDDGDIVETGTHKELLLLNGTYADIYNSQFAQTAV